MKNKYDAEIDFLRQEKDSATAKSSDTISDLEQHVAQYKSALDDSESQRQRQIRELEQVQQQDKSHLEQLHEKKLRAMQKEIDLIDLDHQKKVRKLEQSLRDKDEEIKRISDQHCQQMAKAEQSLDDFKQQVERNSGRMFDDLKHQMAIVEADLDRSKQLREKQAEEFNKQYEEMKSKHDQEVAAVKVSFQQERSQLIHNHQAAIELLHSENDQEVASLKEMINTERKEMEVRNKGQKTRDSKTINEMEHTIRNLRDEVVQANNLRKQQLVELGLLREEEKQKQTRDHEAQISKLKSQMEQQRLNQQKQHSSEMEQALEKTNSRLRDIEKEYSQRNQKSSETIMELNNTIEYLRNEAKRERDQREMSHKEAILRIEEDKRSLERQHTIAEQSLQEQLDSQSSMIRNLELKVQQQEVDSEQKIIQVKMQHEERIKGLLPAGMQKDLEETIVSLKSQIGSLHQRTSLLQDELARRETFPRAFHSTPIKL